MKQIYLRVGYSKQFNLETNISNRSTIMVMLLRDKKHTINELNMKFCENYTYSFDKNNKRIIYEKSNEKLDSFPEIFVFIFYNIIYIYLYRRIGIVIVK